MDSELTSLIFSKICATGVAQPSHTEGKELAEERPHPEVDPAVDTGPGTVSHRLTLPSPHPLPAASLAWVSVQLLSAHGAPVLGELAMAEVHGLCVVLCPL